MRRVFPVVLCLLGLISAAVPAAARKHEKPPKTYAIPLPPKPDYSSLEWLIGEWAGKTTGRGAQGEVHLSAQYDLDQRFVILREKLHLAATANVPAVDESWLGILSGRGAGDDFTLRVYSSTGFMTRYRVTVDKAQIRFTPEGGGQPPPGWLFRRVVARSGPGELTETVEAAPPNGSFFNYYAAQLTRKPPPKPAVAPEEKPAAAPGEKPAEKTPAAPSDNPE